MYTVRHRHTGAPLPVFNPDLDPGLVSSYDLLDAKLLLAEHKLRLAKVHGDVSSSRAGRLHEIHLTELDDGDLETKTDTDPSYAASTKSVENRVAARRPRILETVPSYLRKSHQTLSDEEWRLKTATARAVAASRKNEMTMSARDEEELVLRRMRARANFIPNPRHAVTDGGSENFHELFAVDPPIVRFVEYEIGATYELRLTIRNKSHLSRRVRVVPTASRHFSVTECVWPSAHGVLAPGMACVTHVRFKPESLADYEDFVGVLGETCKGRVPIEGTYSAFPKSRHCFISQLVTVCPYIAQYMTDSFFCWYQPSDTRRDYCWTRSSTSAPYWWAGTWSSGFRLKTWEAAGGSGWWMKTTGRSSPRRCVCQTPPRMFTRPASSTTTRWCRVSL